MSIRLFITPDTCKSQNLQDAEVDCHLVKLDNVFMLFFSSTSLARFHFYAERNYYESQSARFFLPYNQWLTI